MAEAQASIQKHADPAERFIELLQSLFSSGRAHLKCKDDETISPNNAERWGWKGAKGDGLAGTVHWQPQGIAIGWVDACNVYIDPQAAYAELDRLARETGEPLPSPRTLWKRLGERGVIRVQHEADGSRALVKRRIGGRRKRICEIPVATLYVEISGAKGASHWDSHGSRAGETPVTMRPREGGPNIPNIRPTCENPEKKRPDFTRLVEDEANRLAGNKKPDRDMI